MTLCIGIYIYPDVEVLDFAGPYEVFTTASRVFQRSSQSAPPFKVVTVAHDATTIRARAGLVVEPDAHFGNCPHLDILVVPGGVVDRELQACEVIGWIARRAESARLTASVCTGSFLLGKAGLLGTSAVTTHWEDIAEMRKLFPELDVVEGARWVEVGDIITSAGISAGIDMSLHIVERMAGRELALATAKQMDFAWQENPAASN